MVIVTKIHESVPKNFFGIGPTPWTIDDIIYSTADMEPVQHRRKPTM
jgi:hypothetical protein